MPRSCRSLNHPHRHYAIEGETTTPFSVLPHTLSARRIHSWIQDEDGAMVGLSFNLGELESRVSCWVQHRGGHYARSACTPHL